MLSQRPAGAAYISCQMERCGWSTTKLFHQFQPARWSGETAKAWRCLRGVCVSGVRREEYGREAYSMLRKYMTVRFSFEVGRSPLESQFEAPR